MYIYIYIYIFVDPVCSFPVAAVVVIIDDDDVGPCGYQQF